MIALLQAGTAEPVSQIGISDYLRLLFVLAVILALAWWTLRFGIPKLTGISQQSSGAISVLARHPLEPRKTLYVVKAGQGVLLLGSSDAGLQLLSTLKAEDFAEIESQISASPAAPFTRFFRKPGQS
jgi:flagellar protein FliO/FliZ